MKFLELMRIVAKRIDWGSFESSEIGDYVIGIDRPKNNKNREEAITNLTEYMKSSKSVKEDTKLNELFEAFVEEDKIYKRI